MSPIRDPRLRFALVWATVCGLVAFGFAVLCYAVAYANHDRSLSMAGLIFAAVAVVILGIAWVLSRIDQIGGL